MAWGGSWERFADTGTWNMAGFRGRTIVRFLDDGLTVVILTNLEETASLPESLIARVLELLKREC